MDYSVDIGPHATFLTLLYITFKFLLPVILIFGVIAFLGWLAFRAYDNWEHPDSLTSPSGTSLQALILIAAAGVILLVIISVFGG